MVEADRKPVVAIFAPSLVLTTTIEDHGGGPDLHVHAGGQGVWQARMLEELGVDVVLATVLTGETGALLGHLLVAEEHVDLLSVARDGIGAAYVHDRRGGRRETVMETAGDPLTRHDLDELYGLALRAGLAADATVLSGPAGDGVVPDDVYRRLAADLRAAGRVVVADLAGSRLDAVLEGGVDVLKVSDEELAADGLAESDGDEDVLAAMRRLTGAGARHVIVTRSADQATLASGPDGVVAVQGPSMQVVDTRGSGDSLTAAVVAVLARGGGFEEGLRLGTAAGAANVTRHGLASADAALIESLLPMVEVRAVAS